MGEIKIGRVRIGWKGTWDNLTAYVAQDAVYHQGETYVARIDVPAGTAITNTTFWELVAKKGEDGATGAQGPQGPAGGVLSDPTGVTGADAVANILSMTQAEYNAISTPDAATLYLILGETNVLYLGENALFSSSLPPTYLFAGGQQGLLFKPER